MKILLTAACLLFGATVLLACGSDEDSSSSSTTTTTTVATTTTAATTTEPPVTTSTTEAPVEPQQILTHKMMLTSEGSPFPDLGYECQECTFEQWLTIDPPEGWSKGPAQVILPDNNELRSRPSAEGAPDSVDFLDEMPGEEYELIVRNLSVELVGRSEHGIVAKATVERDTLLGFTAGRRVHELTDPNGDVFVLFAYGIDPVDPVIPDFEDPEVLGDFTGPDGWTYSTRIIDEDLWLDTPDTTTVLAIRNELTSTWELLA